MTLSFPISLIILCTLSSCKPVQVQRITQNEVVCKEPCLHYCINLPHFIIAADFDRVHLLMHMYPNGTDGCRIYAGVCCDTAEEHDVSPGPVPGPSKYTNKRVLKTG